VIGPAFGDGSRRRHEAAACAAGGAWRTLELPSIGLDADTPEDLDELGAAHHRGERTSATLKRFNSGPERRVRVAPEPALSMRTSTACKP
jgi:2-phospho-L-lactate guanylyltransferase (CobY/MobA/RfbA family)